MEKEMQLSGYGDNKLLVFNGNSLVLHKRKSLRTISISNISSIQLHPPAAFKRGIFEIFTQEGLPEGIPSLIKGNIDNQVIYGSQDADMAEKIYAAVNEALANRSIAQPITAAPTFSVADEIIKLKALVDKGLLTDAEFDMQKKKLLDL